MRIRTRTSLTGAKTIGQKLFLSVFFGIFALVGSILLVVMGTAAIGTLRTYAWDETPCTIVASGFNADDGVETGAAGWQVRYRYVVAGEEFFCTTISMGWATRDTSEDRRLSQRYAPGVETTCYVNAGDPAEAVLFRGSLGDLVWLFFPLPFAAVGFGGLYFVWRRPRTAADGTAVAPPLTSGATGTTAKAGVIMVLFFGVFLVVGAVGTWALGVRPLLRVLDASDWPAVPCTIVSGHVAEHDSDDGYTYSVELVYRYEFEGRSYTSDRYHFMSGSSSGRAGKQAVVDRHPPGSATVCFVNPDDPTDAVIERGFSATMLFGFIPLVFFIVGLGGVAGVFVNRARGKARAAGDIWGRAGLRPSLQTGAAATRPGGSETRPTVGSDGPVVLETRGKRTGKFIGLMIFGVIWNGIVSIFVVAMINDGWSGFSWFMALFLVPFVGVGLLVLGMAVHAGLAIFNPHPRLFLAKGALAPGEWLDLRWEMLGDTRRLRRFRIQLEGREEATYRRGTDTHTDKSVFALIDLADATTAADIAAGAARVQLPAETMHSFASQNNKVVWALHVRGDIPRWPDIDDEFPFTVLARSGGNSAEA